MIIPAACPWATAAWKNLRSLPVTCGRRPSWWALPFLDAMEFAEFNRVDGMHLLPRVTRALAERLSQVIPGLL